MNQVITIRPDGSIIGLDHKKKGLDLRQFGKANIRRVTLIEWHEHYQLWMISWTEEVCFPSETWMSTLFEDAGINWSDHNGLGIDQGGESLILFSDYDDAVGAEVAVVQAMQLSGDTLGIFG
jgi:hypothetical protein